MMKFLLCLFLFLASASLSPAYAADESVRGVVDMGKTAKLPPATTKQFEEALAVSDACKVYNFTNIRYDCDCMGLKFLDLRRAQGDDASAYWLREEAQHSCPNKPGVAGMIYSRCVNWAPLERGEDYDAFCSCYGSEYAKVYAKNPSENQLVVEAQMIHALKKCNVNSVNEKKQDMRAVVQKLKDEGAYDELFPSAKDEN